MIKFVLFLILAIFLAWCGTTVKLGDHTFAGHVKRIWRSEETKDLRKGIKDKASNSNTKDVADEMKDGARPVVEEVKRKVKGEPDQDDSTEGSSDRPAPAKAP